MSIDYFNACRTTYELPTKWLWFYVKVRFPIGFIVSIANIFSISRDLDLSLYDAVGGFLIISLITADILMLALMCWVYFEMKNLTARGYKNGYVTFD